MRVEIEETFNPNVRNFYFEKPFFKSGVSFYCDKNVNTFKKEYMSLCRIEGLKRVLLLTDMLFVEKNETADFELIEPQIMAEIADFRFDETVIPDDKALFEKIDALIEARVRPFLVRDEGNIELVSFNDGVLHTRFEGHCKGCVHADLTLKGTVEAILKKYIFQIKEVCKEI